MKINEVEEILQVTRANIRYYEKEGLLEVKRGENKYRDYSGEDIARLKKILVFRKLGIPVEKIRQLLCGEAELSAVLEENIAALEGELKELQGALDISRKMQSAKTEMNNFDEEYYWLAIHSEEEKGNKFIDLCKDIAEAEAWLWEDYCRRRFNFDFSEMRKKHGIPKVLAYILLICLGNGLVHKFIWQNSFIYGFLYPFMIFAMGSAVLLPLLLLSKKHPKIAGNIAAVLLMACVLFLALIVLFIVFCIINSIFHFI